MDLKNYGKDTSKTSVRRETKKKTKEATMAKKYECMHLLSDRPRNATKSSPPSPSHSTTLHPSMGRPKSLTPLDASSSQICDITGEDEQCFETMGSPEEVLRKTSLGYLIEALVGPSILLFDGKLKKLRHRSSAACMARACI